jgi:hypothetical protein
VAVPIRRLQDVDTKNDLVALHEINGLMEDIGEAWQTRL